MTLKKLQTFCQNNSKIKNRCLIGWYLHARIEDKWLYGGFEGSNSKPPFSMHRSHNENMPLRRQGIGCVMRFDFVYTCQNETIIIDKYICLFQIEGNG